MNRMNDYLELGLLYLERAWFMTDAYLADQRSDRFLASDLENEANRKKSDIERIRRMGGLV